MNYVKTTSHGPRGPKVCYSQDIHKKSQKRKKKIQNKKEHILKIDRLLSIKHN
jgi:hypothetical protein